MEVNMEKFREDIIFNYKPSVETYQLGLLVMEKLGKLNVRMKDVLDDYMRPSRIFAFIESKYSSRIEGIYTTLFENVNTGVNSEKQNLIKPLVDELFRSKSVIDIPKLKEIAEILNTGVSQAKRFEKDFGIYKSEENKKVKIYQPPMEKEDVELLLQKVVTKAENDKNIIQMIHTHIMYEKVHPFVDGNGRLGRLILVRSMARLMNFANVLPISHAIYSDLTFYYEAFVISSNKDLDNGIQNILNIMLKMYEITKSFLSDLHQLVTKKMPIIKQASNKV